MHSCGYPGEKNQHRVFHIMADSSAHGKQVELVVYKLSVEDQSTSITTTTSQYKRRYTYRLGDSARCNVKTQHYILLLLWRLGPLTSNEILSYLQEAGYNVRSLRDLHSRIYYLRQNKLVVRDENGRYRLTDIGEKYAEELGRQYLIFAKGSEKIRNILANIGIFSSIEDVLKMYGRYIENKLSKILHEIRELFKLNEDETIIMEYLFEQLRSSILIGRRSRSAYSYASIMMKDLGFDSVYFKELICKLQSKGLVYMYPQRNGMPARIGLKPELVDKIWRDLVTSGSSIYTGAVNETMLLKSASQRSQIGEADNG